MFPSVRGVALTLHHCPWHCCSSPCRAEMPLLLQNRSFGFLNSPGPGPARWSVVLKRPGGVRGGQCLSAGWVGRWAVFLSLSFSPSLPLKISKLKQKSVNNLTTLPSTWKLQIRKKSLMDRPLGPLISLLCHFLPLVFHPCAAGS